ncbi:hypothetical protein B2M27_09840 [Kluyvera intermedia]|uniref:Uncharacterized protein n=1 Tax=Kluyvera intermedia TaxID=61648 RepID=A0ABX3UHF7_KLUIN|nr:hypothetical protein [Kluyvera intermedia]ORJ50567.1 hypothetical protein B2M27_09840 [Kluyvera intermedia]
MDNINEMKRAMFSRATEHGQENTAIKITWMWFRFGGNQNALKLQRIESAEGIAAWWSVFCLNGETAYQNDIQGITAKCVDTIKWEIYLQRKAEIWERNLPVAAYEFTCRQLASKLGICL